MDIANHGLFLLQQLNSQREFGFLCDCTVAIGDVYFKAHKAVLAAFSNYFKMLFIHQTSDCVKLKPADIQPDIFSYLLHLMYTGKIIPQMIDPVRLEQGLKFLHAYPLLQEASLATHGAIPRPDPYFPWPSSLYGIQLARSQACVTVQEQKVHMMAAGLSSHSGPPPQSQPQQQQQPPLQSQPQSQSQPPPRSEQEQNVIEGPIPMSVSVTQAQTHLALQLPLQSTLQQPSQSAQPSCLPYSPGILAQDSTGDEQRSHSLPSLDGQVEGQLVVISPRPASARRGSVGTSGGGNACLIGSGTSTTFPRCYVCHICGRRFSLRSSLREHLYMHTGVPYPQSAVGGRGRGRGRGRGSLRRLQQGSPEEEVMMEQEAVETEVLIDGDGSYHEGSRALCSPGVAACEGRHQASPGQPDREAGTPGGAEGAVDSPPTPGGGEDEEAGDGEFDLGEDTEGEGEGDSDGTDGAMFEGYRRVGRTRRFACNVCGRRFTQKSHCKEHMYIHTGKPYSCGICNKTFSRATQAARHVCQCHTPEPKAEANIEPLADHNAETPDMKPRPGLEGMMLGGDPQACEETAGRDKNDGKSNHDGKNQFTSSDCAEENTQSMPK